MECSVTAKSFKVNYHLQKYFTPMGRWTSYFVVIIHAQLCRTCDVRLGQLRAIAVAQNTNGGTFLCQRQNQSGKSGGLAAGGCYGQ